MRELVNFRRARREEYRHIEIPHVFTGMPTPIRVADGSLGDNGAVRGKPAGPGVFEGTVRVILDADSQDSLEDGEVLVCKFVDPGWTALVSLAGHSSLTSAVPRATARSSPASWASPVSLVPVTAPGRSAPATSYALTERRARSPC
ncbi:putative pyruvate, water dikinase [Mycobacterium xenopi 3993]|nr:putative pyruvate, water dikinase [Mycobacterium xenopi 3993]